jgi:hypothetical protein
VLTFKTFVLTKVMDIDYTKEAPLVHGWRKMKAVSRIDWGLGGFAHGIMIALFFIRRLNHYQALPYGIALLRILSW